MAPEALPVQIVLSEPQYPPEAVSAIERALKRAQEE
jgi:hypothetical protein